MSTAINSAAARKQNPFSTGHLLKDLKAHTVHGTAATSIAQGFKFVVQLISIAVLARLLTPADFGLVAMATVMTGLLGMFRDGGLSMATIQRAEVTHGQVSNLFWINAALGLALALITIALAPLIALIYDEPRLVWICIAISASFLIGGLSLQHDALLRRQMRFKAIAYIDVISMTCGVISGIASAWAGLGYWALVVMPLVAAVCQTGMTWLALDWRPSWLQRGTEVRPLLNFGASLTGANLVGYLAANMTPFVIGLMGGTQQLGLYNRANTLTSIPLTQIITPVMSVAQPALARLAADPERFRRAALSLIRKVSLVAMFITVTMMAMADWIVEIFLGPGWVGAVPLFRLLAVFSLVEPVATVTTMMLIAAGQAKAVLKWRFVSFFIIAASVAVGARWGVMGIVAAYSLSGLALRLPLFLAYATRYLPITKADFFKALFPFIGLATVFSLLLVFVQFAIEIRSAYLGIAIFLPLSIIAYTLIALTIKPTRKELGELFQLLMSAIHKKHIV